jgi:hypothetical protein
MKPVCVTLISCWLAMPQAQQLDPARPAIDAYQAAIQAAQQDPARGRLETALNAIGPLRQALLQHRDGGASVVESLQEQELASRCGRSISSSRRT